MPPAPGEESMLTVFADIHSYFSEPTPKPTHHRFDKGSYLYIYHDANQHRSRMEVANNAGTPDQDAFHGGELFARCSGCACRCHANVSVLNRVHLCHSTRFPSLCTLTVDGFDPNPPSFPPPPDPESVYEWRLPRNDPHGENTDLLRLHTLDIYFWTSEDAGEFLDLMERILSQGQIETDRHDPPEEAEQDTNNNENEHKDLSTVVRQLENVAVTDPAYQNGQTRNSRSDLVSGSTSTPETYAGGATAAGDNSFPPPPPAPATAPVSTAPAQPTQQTSTSPAPAQEQQYAPIPYNPAAPAAPEPIQHREKTPPPADGADGTGLAAAVAVDNGLPYAPPQTQPTVGGSFAPPPPPATHQFQPQPQAQGQQLPYSVSGGYASPPPSAGLPPHSAAGLTHSGPGSQSSRPQSTSQSPGFMSAYNQAPVAPSPSSPFFPGSVGTGNPVQQQQLSRAGSVSFPPPPPQTQPQIQPQQQVQQPVQQPVQHQDPNAAASLYLYQQQQLLQQQQQQQAYVCSPVQAQPQLQQSASSQGTPITTTFTTPAQQYSFPQSQQQPRTLDVSDPHVQLMLQQQQHQQQQQMLAAGQPPSAQRHGRLENGAARVEGRVNKFLQKLNKF